MKDSFQLFRTRSDVYRALQLFFMTSSTLIAISYAFPGLLHVPWLYPLIVFWAFVLMIVSFYFGQTAIEEEEEEFAEQPQNGNEKEPEQTPLWEQLQLRSVLTQQRNRRDEDELV